jgi:hypothetical protein
VSSFVGQNPEGGIRGIYSKGVTGICQLSIFLLFRIRWIKYSIAIWCMDCIRDLMVGLGYGRTHIVWLGHLSKLDSLVVR